MTRSLLPICSVVTSAILAHSATALAVDCFIDSVAGNDANTGLAEDQAVQTQAKIPASCTVAKFKRGSQFNEAVKVSSKITTYTNYGDPCTSLPKFSKQRSPNNGSMFSSFGSGVIIDGLYLAGSMSDSSMSNLINGVCVMLGSNSKLLNSEITNCDIGIMLSGTGNLVQGNYVHDLYISVDAAPGVDPNAVGGAEGIFINGSNNEVAYNSFIRCSSTAEWTGGTCDGGATEVSVGAGATLSGVKVHHNFSYKSCGFFEMASMAGSSKGTFADSEFYNNVSVDSGWLMLLQVNNTNTSNIRWENNTIVQHKSESLNPGMLVTVFTGTSSGVSGGSLQKDTVFLTNDLFILDGFGAQDYVSPLDANLNLVNTLTIKSPGESAGVVNVAGTTAADFDLVAGSSAIDQGTATTRTLDFLNRTAPAGSAMDVGAFEFGSSLASGQPTPIPAEDLVTGKSCGSTGGATGTGGSTATATGGATTVSTGGGTATAAGGGATVSTGGATESSAGGTQATGGASSTGMGGTSNSTVGGTTSVASATGGQTTSTTSNGQGGSGTATSAPQGGQTTTGGSAAQSSGGQMATTSGNPASTGGQTGTTSTGSGSVPGQGGNSVGKAGGGANPGLLGLGDNEGSCGCRMVGHSRDSVAGLWLLGLLAGLLRRSRRHR